MIKIKRFHFKKVETFFQIPNVRADMKRLHFHNPPPSASKSRLATLKIGFILQQKSRKDEFPFWKLALCSSLHRVSQNILPNRKKKSPNENWVLLGQFFRWRWLGSAWSCFVLDQTTFFQTHGVPRTGDLSCTPRFQQHSISQFF